MPLFRRRNRSNNAEYSMQMRRFKEKNILSAILGTITIVVLCASLVEPVWFRLEGGKCCQSYLGVNAFFGSIGTIEYKGNTPSEECKEAETEGKNLYEYCVNAKILVLIQVIIVLCVLAILTSLFSFVLDIIAPRKKPLWKVLKRYAFGYVFTDLFVATTVGFCYWASEEMYQFQNMNRLYSGSKVKVSFSTGVYLLSAGGGIAILATASNLMRQYPTEEEEQAEMLMDEESDEDESPWGNITEPEPPAYAP